MIRGQSRVLAHGFITQVNPPSILQAPMSKTADASRAMPVRARARSMYTIEINGWALHAQTTRMDIENSAYAQEHEQ